MSGSLTVQGPGTPALRGSERLAEAWRNGFIVSPAFDLFYFILAPVLALAIIRTLVVGEFTWVAGETTILGVSDTRLGFFIAIWNFAHIAAVVFRSHANPDVFARYRLRFVAVPILLFAALMSSMWVFVVGLVLVGFWDIYHTSMQNFGFCRIYDSRQGNPAERGRMLDMGLNHLLYMGPIFAGESLHTTLAGTLSQFRHVGWDMPFRAAESVVAAREPILLTILVLGGAYVAYYIYAYWQMSRQGYRYSPQKALLLLSTGGVSIYAWSYLHPIGAFFVTNFFHALQYFAIVWSRESTNITRLFRFSELRFGVPLALVAYLACVFAVAFWYKIQASTGALHWATSIGIVLTLMHFWWDGFVWSVRKQQV